MRTTAPYKKAVLDMALAQGWITPTQWKAAIIRINRAKEEPKNYPALS